MIRTQIQLTEEQAERLRQISLDSHESIASLIRKALNQFLINEKPSRKVLYRQAASVIGKYKADRSDVSINHDQYLVEDFSDGKSTQFKPGGLSQFRDHGIKWHHSRLFF